MKFHASGVPAHSLKELDSFRTNAGFSILATSCVLTVPPDMLGCVVKVAAVAILVIPRELMDPRWHALTAFVAGTLTSVIQTAVTDPLVLVKAACSTQLAGTVNSLTLM